MNLLEDFLTRGSRTSGVGEENLQLLRPRNGGAGRKVVVKFSFYIATRRDLWATGREGFGNDRRIYTLFAPKHPRLIAVLALGINYFWSAILHFVFTFIGDISVD